MKKIKVRKDTFSDNEFEKSTEEKKALAQWSYKKCVDLDQYEFKFQKESYSGKNISMVKSIPEMIKFLQNNKECEIEARIWGIKDGKAKRFNLNRESFLKVIKENKRKDFRETFDSFDTIGLEDASVSSLIGEDYVPTLGGPFTKNLIYSSGWLQQAMAAFYAVNHDPISKAIVNIKSDFVLGRGFRTDCKDKKALALWRSFEKVNKLNETIKKCYREALIYGETMIHWLPKNQMSYYYNSRPGEVKTGFIPRLFIEDPTSCWEIITRPEAPNDDESRIAYVFIYPTQYQIFSTSGQPTSKFIYDQIPANEIMHFALNTVSNEKRGRSDLFSTMGYAKRIRDSINYGLVRDLKSSAFSFDVSIDGSQADINQYIKSSEELGTIPSAGSEFVHSTRVKRELVSTTPGGSVESNTFNISMSMICMGSRLPFSYFGTYFTGGTTRAGALTATEPVAKHFEDHQGFCESILNRISERFFEEIGYKSEDGSTPVIEVTFPEITTQDRSGKIKDLTIAVQEKYISRRRAAEISAKELGITDYDFEQEQAEIKKEEDIFGPIGPIVDPLTNYGDDKSSSGMDSDEKEEILNDEYK